MTRRQHHPRKGVQRRISSRAINYRPAQDDVLFSHHARTYALIVLIALGGFFLVARGAQPSLSPAGYSVDDPSSQPTLFRGDPFQIVEGKAMVCNPQWADRPIQALPYDDLRTTLPPFVKMKKNVDIFSRDNDLCVISTNFVGVISCVETKNTPARQTLLESACLPEGYDGRCAFVVQRDDGRRQRGMTIACSYVIKEKAS